MQTKKNKEIENKIKHENSPIKKIMHTHTHTHYKNHRFPATNSTSFIYALYIVGTLVKTL